MGMRKRFGLTAAAATLAVAGVIGAAGSASAWTNSADISCHTSTGWQIHIYSQTTGYTYDRLTWGSTYVWDLGYRTSGTVAHVKTAKADASSVSVSAGTVYAASRSCGTA